MASLQDSDPRQVAAYRLVERIAVGGMGIIYLGESPSGRPVAVKLIRSDLARDPEFRARFRREVTAARLAGGYHTAAVVDADPDADPPWMVTQYVPGPSLDALVKGDGPLEQAALHRLAAALAESLHAIHSRGLVHRDLKPLNIIMADDGPMIIDFGIAKIVGASSDPWLTATGMVVGTPAFLSPEQIDGSPVGPPSDIFSLGSVLAFAATGRLPFEGRDFITTSYAIVNKSPDVRPLAGPLLDIVNACLDKDPARRPTASDLLTYLYKTRQASAAAAQADAADQAAAAAGARPDPAPPAPPAPVPREQATVGRMPGRPAPARAAIRRGALHRAAAPAVRGNAPLPVKAQPRPSPPAPPQLQVRPVRHGWRLVVADPGGRWLASANGDGIITAWNAGSGLPVRCWAAGAQVRAIAAGPDDLLVVATSDGRVRAWNVALGTECRYLPATVPGLTGPGVRVRGLALDSSGCWLAASVERRVLLWDVTDPNEPVLAAGLPSRADVTALAFDDTGRLLAAGDETGKVRAWDFARLAAAVPASAESGDATFDPVPLETASIDLPGTLPDVSRPHAGPVLALAWHAAGERWLSVSTTPGPRERLDGDIGTDPVPWPAGITGTTLRAAALSPGGWFAAMIDSDRGRVHLAGLDNPAHPRALDGADLVITGVAFAGSGLLALGGSDGSLRLWHLSRHAMRIVSVAGSPVTAIAATPDGASVVVRDKHAGLRFFAAVHGSLLPGWSTVTPEPGASLAFRADGRLLAAAGETVRTWNVADGSEAGVLPGRTGRVRAVAADHDGTRLAAAWAEAVVTVWDGKRLLCELTGHKGDVLTVAFGPRPGLLVSAGADETIRTWDLAAGREAACHSRLGYRITVLAASHSGETVAAGCADGTVRLYQAGPRGALPDWADAPVLDGHAHGITAMSFDPASRLLATASRDGTARIWDLATRSATTVLLPGETAAVRCADGSWRGLGETEGLIWQAVGLTRVPISLLEAVT